MPSPKNSKSATKTCKMAIPVDPSEILSNDIMRCLVFDKSLQFGPVEDTECFYEQNTSDLDIDYFRAIRTVIRLRNVHLNGSDEWVGSIVWMSSPYSHFIKPWRSSPKREQGNLLLCTQFLYLVYSGVLYCTDDVMSIIIFSHEEMDVLIRKDNLDFSGNDNEIIKSMVVGLGAALLGDNKV